MAPDDDKRKPPTAEHLAALDGLERGMRFNVIHSVARELIELGYASNDWGQLAITEAGRVAVRRPYPIISEHVANLNAAKLSDDPFANPDAVPIAAPPPPVKLSPARDSRERAQRAAGVASGKCGNWPNEAWVEAFIEAFDESAE